MTEARRLQKPSEWLAAWGMEQPQRVDFCTSGVDNESWRITAADKNYILTRMRELSAAQLEPVLKLMRQLQQAGLPVASVVPTATGEAFGLDGGQPVLLQECLSGAPASEELEISPQQCAQAGEILARMHLTETQPGELPGEDWSALALTLAGRHLASLSFAQQQLYQRELKVLQVLDENLPAGVIHNDLFCDNLLFDGGAVSGLIDLYSARRGQYVTDLAIALLDWGWDPVQYAYDAARAQALVAGYQSLRPLSAAEQAALPKQMRACGLAVWMFRIKRSTDNRDLPQNRRPDDMVLRLGALPPLLAEGLC